MVPWHHYEWFGDPQILRDNFDMMRRFTDYIGREAKEGIAPAGLGDWYDYGHGQALGPSKFTPVELSAMAIFHDCTRKTAQAAEVLGKSDDDDNRAAALLRDNLLIYGIGGVIAPFIGIKLIDVIITALRLV